MPQDTGGGAAHTIVNVLGLAGVVAGYVALAALSLEHPLAGLGMLAVLAVAVAAFVMPAGQALGVGLGNPAAVDGRTRVGALIAGAAGLFLGWLVLHAHTAAAVPVGLLLMGVSAMALTLSLYPPLPSSWPLPGGTLAAGVLLLVAGVMGRELQDRRTRSHYDAMRESLMDLVSAQGAARTDSGRYSAALDTALLPHLDSFLLTDGRVAFTLTADGWRASASTPRVDARCAAFAGSDPEPPATEPGLVACTPYPDRDVAALGTLWLLALAVTTAGAFWLRPRGRTP